MMKMGLQTKIVWKCSMSIDYFIFFHPDESLEAEDEMYSPTQNSILLNAAEDYDCPAIVHGNDNLTHINGTSSVEEHVFDSENDQIMSDAVDVHETCAFIEGKYDFFNVCLILIDILFNTHFIFVDYINLIN